MAKTVQRSVAVHHPETREAHWFGPGDKLPAWAEPLVTNKKVFTKPDGSEDIQQPDEQQVEEPEFDDGNGEVNYEDLTSAELELLCEERGLAKGGNKQEKIERLRMDDDASS